MCREWLARHPEVLPFRAERLGAWWDRAHEIDILAYDDHNVLFGECKWSEKPVTPSALAQLQKNAAAVAGFEHHRKYHALFARSGFQGEFGTAMLFDLEQVLGPG